MRILGSSIPKSGSHYLKSVFVTLEYNVVVYRKPPDQQLSINSSEINNLEKVYGMGHWRYSNQAADQMKLNGFHVLCLVRDPRDVCLSMADYLHSGLPGVAHRKEPALRDMSLRELIKNTITGFNLPNFQTVSADKIFRGWAEWRDVGGIIIKYEDLLDQAQHHRYIGALSGIGLDPELFFQSARENLRSPDSLTMNKGVAARWKTEFDDELLTIWRTCAPGVASRLGYEEV